MNISSLTFGSIKIGAVVGGEHFLSAKSIDEVEEPVSKILLILELILKWK